MQQIGQRKEDESRWAKRPKELEVMFDKESLGIESGSNENMPALLILENMLFHVISGVKTGEEKELQIKRVEEENKSLEEEEYEKRG